MSRAKTTYALGKQEEARKMKKLNLEGGASRQPSAEKAGS